MDRIMSYVDDLMMNQPLDSDYVYTPSSSESNYFDEQEGGRLDQQKGLGGFPPIYVCDKTVATESPFEEEKQTKREYSKHKTAVSITNIMKERRKIKPFISLSRIEN